MGRNFDDYPGFHPFRPWANTYAQDCIWTHLEVWNRAATEIICLCICSLLINCTWLEVFLLFFFYLENLFSNWLILNLKYFIRALYTSGYLIDTLFVWFMDPWFRSDYKAVGRSENPDGVGNVNAYPRMSTIILYLIKILRFFYFSP